MGKPVLIHNVDEFSDFNQRESVLDLNLKSILCVPLISKGDVLGVLYLDSQKLKAPFTPDQIELLLAFGSHAAIALENARLYEMAIVDRAHRRLPAPPLRRAPRRGVPARGPARLAALAAVHRRRPLQEGERHLRPPGRRRGRCAVSRAALKAEARNTRHRRPLRRRGVRAAGAGDAARRRRAARRAHPGRGARAALQGREAATLRHHRLARRCLPPAGGRRDARGPRPRPPTPPCSRPSAWAATGCAPAGGQADAPPAGAK